MYVTKKIIQEESEKENIREKEKIRELLEKIDI